MAFYYWVGGNGTWDNSSKTNWATSTGGSGGFGPPTSTDTVNFDANSGTAAVVTMAATAACTGAVVNKSDINITLSGSPTVTDYFQLTSGTLTVGSYTLSCARFLSNNANARTLSFSGGKIRVTGSGTNVWDMTNVTGATVSGTFAADFVYAGATGTRSIWHGVTAGSAATALNVSITAGTDTVTFTGGNQLGNLDFTGFSGTGDVGATNRTLYGSVTLSTGMTVTGGAGATTFAGTGTQAITSNGKTYDAPITVNGTGNTVTLVDNLTMGTSRLLRLTNGTFDAANKNVTIGTFALSAGTKTLTMGSGTWTVAGASWNANSNVAGLTVTPSTATITMTSASAKNFLGGGLTWPTLNQGGSGSLTIQQSNTFTNITNTVQPATVTLTAGTTQKVTTLGLSGTAGNLITLNSGTAGTKAYISAPYQTITLSYMAIQDIYFKGGAIWLAANSTDSGNNFGISFSGSSGIVARYSQRKQKVIPGI